MTLGSVAGIVIDVAMKDPFGLRQLDLNIKSLHEVKVGSV